MELQPYSMSTAMKQVPLALEDALLRYQPALVVPAMALFLLTLLSAAHAASFDCARAASPVEQTICHNGKLSHLDETLASAYKKALASAPDREALLASQRAWVATRNACPDAACLEQAYHGRIEALRTGKTAATPQPAAASDASQPYSGDKDPAAGVNANGDALYATAAVIVDYDMFRLFTNKGDFYWAPWMQAKAVDAMERTAAGLKGREARITYSRVAGKGGDLQPIVEGIAK